MRAWAHVAVSMVALAGVDPVALGPLPPAIRAHLLLDSMERGTLRGRDAMEFASQAIGQVDERWAIETTGAITNRSSDIHSLVASMARGLDRDSLRHRWILQLLRDSPVDAREALLLAAELPAEPKCSDGWAFHRKQRWIAAAAVFQRGFTTREIADGKRLAYFEQLLVTSSVMDYRGITAFLKSLPAGEERASLTKLFLSKVADEPVGPRTFHVLISNGFVQDLAELGFDPAAFVRRNLASQVCTETLTSSDPEDAPAPVKSLAGLGISKDDWADAKDLGAAKVQNYWTTARSRALLKAAQRLRYGAGGGRQDERGFNILQAEEDRELERWRIERDDLLSSLESWTENVGSSATAHDLRQICALLQAIVEAEPAGSADRAKLEKRYADFLAQRASGVLPDAEWLWLVEQFVSASPTYPLHLHRPPWMQAYGTYRSVAGVKP
jgi:hypothetical protein